MSVVAVRCPQRNRESKRQRRTHHAGAMRLLALALSAVTARAACRNVTIDFLLLETNSMTAAIKDDIRSDLAVIGIDVVSRVVDYETFIADMVAGNLSLIHI